MSVALFATCLHLYFTFYMHIYGICPTAAKLIGLGMNVVLSLLELGLIYSDV